MQWFDVKLALWASQFFLEGNGFGYNGIYRMIALTFMVLIFLLLPNGETLKGLPKILGYISGCTMGCIILIE